MHKALRKLLLVTTLLVSAIAPSGFAEAAQIGTLRFIGAATVPNDKKVDETLVGGLSGLDYDQGSGTFLAISDDRSDNAPARFYTVRLIFSGDRLFGADVQKATTLLQANGQPYPNGKAGGEVPDPESLRIDPQEPQSIWWTSEGDRNRGLNPSVRKIDRSGKHLMDMAMPANLAVHPDKESGVRNNLAFEALSFAADGASLWVGLEGALYEDGPVATVNAGSVVRFTQFDRTGKPIRQLAYPLDAIPASPGVGKAADNGATEILAEDDRYLLVIERSGVQGDNGIFRDYIRLYEADMQDATDVLAIPALAGATYKPMSKRLVLNLDTANIGYVDNIEGMAWGPKLSNGRPTLILVADNNFNKDEVTQFLAFEVTP